jgi:hypothetical protein
MWTIGGERYRLCWFHDVELHFIVLEWAFDPHRKRKHAAYSAAVIRRVNAERRT